VDFEIVFGRRQMASTGLVVMAALACFSGVFYLIGKSAGAKLSAPEVSAATAAPLAAPDTLVPAGPIPAVTAPAPVTNPEASKPQRPLFAEAVTGKVYIQVGAIEKGLAGIWAEGLRTHGLDAFVATGRNDKEWRVLVGPLPDSQAYRQAKETLDKLGVTTFGRRYTGASPAAR
jgi:cell division septation protein DedD